MNLLEEILSLLQENKRAVLATIVHTQGSIPSFQSSKMLVRADGSIAGTVGGGCVEADVWAAAKEIMETETTRKLTFNLNADPRYDAGLTCGGTLEVYLEPIGPHTDRKIFHEADALTRANRQAVIATVIQAPDHSLKLASAKLLVREDGSFTGTIGEPQIDSQIVSEAQTVLREEKPRKLTLALPGSKEMEIALEPVLPQPTCYLLGAGHVGQYVARVAALAGFKVAVADDREQFANQERFPQAEEVFTGDWQNIFKAIMPGNSSYLVIVTRGHKEDMTVLRWAVGTDARYIGLIGSRRKILSIYNVLAEEGVPRERLERVHAPIGVGIGALTPEEIAVSIVGELIAVRRNAPLSHAMTIGNELARETLPAKP
jgi:xanthine dehydrogenase accessory factor